MPEPPVVINDHYTFLRWLMQRVEQYPRGHRFSLGDRTVHLALAVLERLLEASYSKSKGSLLQLANLDLEKLRFMIRLAKDEHCLSMRQYEFACRSLNEVGKQIGGWRKQAEW